MEERSNEYIHKEIPTLKRYEILKNILRDNERMKEKFYIFVT